MSALSARVRRAEQRIGLHNRSEHPARSFMLIGGGHDDDPPEAFLRALGYVLTEADRIVHQVIVEATAEGPRVAADCPMELMGVSGG